MFATTIREFMPYMLYSTRVCLCVCVCVLIMTVIISIFLPKSLNGSLAINSIDYTYNFPSKAVPLQAWSGPEGSRKLRFPDFTTTAQDSGKVVSLTHRPPLPQKMILVLVYVRG